MSFSGEEDASQTADLQNLHSNARLQKSQFGHAVNLLLRQEDENDFMVKQERHSTDKEDPVMGKGAQPPVPPQQEPERLSVSTPPAGGPSSTTSTSLLSHPLDDEFQVMIDSSSMNHSARPGAYRVLGIESSQGDSMEFDNLESAGETNAVVNNNNGSWVGVEEATTMVMVTKRAEEVHHNDDKKKRFSRKALLWIALVGGMLLLVGIIVGVVVALLSNSTKNTTASSNHATDNATTKSETLSPSIAPHNPSPSDDEPSSRPASPSRTVGYYLANGLDWEGMTRLFIEGGMVLDVNEGRLFNETNETIPYSPTRSDLTTVFATSGLDLLGAMDIGLIQKFIQPIWRGHTINILQNQVLPFELQWAGRRDGRHVIDYRGWSQFHHFPRSRIHQ
jgi:hypothetical protein